MPGTKYFIQKEKESECGEIFISDLVSDFNPLLQVILDDSLNEFQYMIEDDLWKVVLK